MRGGALCAGIDLEYAGHGTSGELHAGTLEANGIAGTALVLTHIRIAHLAHDEHMLDETHIVILGLRLAASQLCLLADEVRILVNGHTVMEPLQSGQRR